MWLRHITVISTRKRVIYTRRVWCWHVWVWLLLWHLYVSKALSACRNHSFVWYSHAYCDEHTHKCNFWKQSVNSTRTSVIYLRSVIFTRTVWFLHAEYNFQKQCDFGTQKCDYDTYNCDFYIHMSDFYTQSVMLTRMSMTLTKVILTLVRVKTAPLRVEITLLCDFHTHTVMSTSVISERRV
jgi:hypothetical protein